MFYDKFKLLCEEKKISCSKAAADIGLSNSTVTKWKKTGAVPVGDTINKISLYFNADANFLLANQPFQYWDDIIANKSQFVAAYMKASEKPAEAISAFYGPCSRDFSDISDYNLMRLVSDGIKSATPIFDSWVISLEDFEPQAQKNQEAAAEAADLSDVKANFIKSVKEMTDEQIMLLQAVVDQVLRENGMR